MAEMTLDALVERLRSLLGAELRVVALSGPPAAEDELPEAGPVRVLVVADALTVDFICEGGALVREWVGGGSPAPFVVTSAEWSSAAEFFPADYPAFAASHRVVFGVMPPQAPS